MKTVLKIMLVVVMLAIVGLISAVISILVMSDSGTSPTISPTTETTKDKDKDKTGDDQADNNQDADNDTLPSDWETKYNLNPNDASDATADGDSDGLNNLEEYKYNTIPDNSDTDGDGFKDGEEVKNGYDPRGTGKLSNSTGETYHVASTGDDSAAGTQSAPWRTLQRAADLTQAGDTVHVHEGVYNEEVAFKKSGTTSSPITFMGATNETVVVKGSLVLEKDVANTNIKNLTIQDFKVWGVTLMGGNKEINLSDLLIIGGESGIHLTYGDSDKAPQGGSVSEITIENSTIKNPQYTAVDCTPGPCDDMTFRKLEITGSGLQGEDSYGADGIAVEKGKNITVEQCYIHDNGGDGVDLNSRDREGNVSGIYVKRNRIVRNHKTGIKLWGGGKIENNAIWGQGFVPIMVGAFPGTYELLYNSIAYNMWDKSFSARNYSLLAGYPNDDTDIPAQIKLTLFNNIFAFNADSTEGGATGIYLGENVNLINESNNIYYSRDDCEIEANFINQADPCIGRGDISDGGWTEVSGQGDQNKGLDPKFMAGWKDVDLKLKADSPAIDAGTSSQPVTIDIEGNERPEAYYPHDIGAYEYQNNQ
ncbi:right-handed parallel beta-helix repeat-containing protein [Patescibacteria group bacterium]|nr:right-handed parallel beta-helix repeat-containing protein [Patescibacteria group bacterium]